MVQKILYFFGGSVQRQKHNTHPANAIIGAGRVGRGLTKGGGVLLGRRTAYFLVEETQCVTMMEIASSWHGKYAFGGQFLEENQHGVWILVT
jgi:hypothetical protein